MFFAQLRNELWKLFGKKRTYIGFGAFLLAQTAMLLAFKYTHWQSDLERLLNGNGYLAAEFISALTVSLQMLIPQVILLMPLYTTLVGGDLVEVSPPYDTSGNTALLAANLLFEMLCVLPGVEYRT